MTSSEVRNGINLTFGKKKVLIYFAMNDFVLIIIIIIIIIIIM